MSIEIIEEEFNPTKIKVIGIGGGGCNAIERMIASEMRHIEFIAANTDLQALMRSHADTKIQLGVQTTRGLGAGANPEIGKQAAEEQLPELEKVLKGTDVLFLTAGMGGGTGTGASPVIAEAARKAGCLTVAVVTKPFHFERGARMKHAMAGIETLSQHVDTLIIIPNQNLLNLRGKNLSINEAFMEADSVLMEGVKGVSDLILKSGFVNVDFADIKTVMENKGPAILSVIKAAHDLPPQEVAENILNNPLLERTDSSEAQAILLNISYGQNVLLSNIDAIIHAITEKIDPQAVCIHGFVANPNYTHEIKLTMIATGLKERSSAHKTSSNATPHSSPASALQTLREQTQQADPSLRPQAPEEEYEALNHPHSDIPEKVYTFSTDTLDRRHSKNIQDPYTEKEAQQNPSLSSKDPSAPLQKLNRHHETEFEEEDLEVPAFLRAKKKLDL